MRLRAWRALTLYSPAPQTILLLRLLCMMDVDVKIPTRSS